MSETIEDIVREMRNKADTIEAVICTEPVGWQELEAKMDSLRKEASRIEAAYKREMPFRNCDRFIDWEDAYIAWAEEEMALSNTDIELTGDNASEQADYLWREEFNSGENRDFMHWAFSKTEKKGGAE